MFVDVCRSFFLDDLSCRFSVTSIICPLDVLSVDVLSVSLLESHPQHMSRVVRKPAFCICENKDADQLRCNHKADQRLCFRYIDSTIPLLHKSEISNLKPSSVAVQPGLCRTWSETPKTGFLTTSLNRETDQRLCFRYIDSTIPLLHKSEISSL